MANDRPVEELFDDVISVVEERLSPPVDARLAQFCMILTTAGVLTTLSVLMVERTANEVWSQRDLEGARELTAVFALALLAMSMSESSSDQQDRIAGELKERGQVVASILTFALGVHETRMLLIYEEFESQVAFDLKSGELGLPLLAYLHVVALSASRSGTHEPAQIAFDNWPGGDALAISRRAVDSGLKPFPSANDLKLLSGVLSALMGESFAKARRHYDPRADL